MIFDESQQEARAILDSIASIAFDDCVPLSKEFRELPMSAGIYAVRHRTIGILYFGKLISCTSTFEWLPFRVNKWEKRA
jgi:hypothetical protein